MDQRLAHGGSGRQRLVAIEELDGTGRETLAAEIDGVLAGRVRDIVLTGRLRKLYCDSSWHQRSRITRAWLIWAAGLNVLMSGIDYLISPAILSTALAVHMIFPPLVFAALLALWNRPRAQWIEGLTLPTVTATLLIAAGVLSLCGGLPVHVRYMDSALCATATAIVILPVGLVWTVVGSAIALGLYTVFSELNPLVETKETVAFCAYFALVIGALTLARRTMNIVLQYGFLLTLRSALQSKALEDANARLSVLANTDGLTGLANRRAFESEAARIWAASGDSSLSLGIALLDIDHFKRLNDAAGHPAGDTCLATVARVIQRAAPECRVVARYGGEEFICLVEQATPRAMLKIGEAIRNAVESCGYPHLGLGEARCVTVSVGISLGAPNGRVDGLGEVIRAADAALYMAKTSGRNRCVPAWAMTTPDAPAEPGRLRA